MGSRKNKIRAAFPLTHVSWAEKSYDKQKCTALRDNSKASGDVIVQHLNLNARTYQKHNNILI